MFEVASAAASAAMAQQVQPAELVEQVTVTGTSVRGVAPVGTNLIRVTSTDIEKSGATTVQSVLANTPVISGLGNAGEGSRIQDNYYQPSIHNLGASCSNATLILVDGHQFPMAVPTTPPLTSAPFRPTCFEPLPPNAQGYPSGGGDPVKANLTFDLHMGYDFKDGFQGDDRLNITIINFANTDPPFYLGAAGYDNCVASPLGRVIKVGLTTTF